ncbi:MAG: hypothetical protein A2Y40_08010 [Candidatus Margulisbacteria bacterium GWF2_35_9]|nr:MAG: hypothetical protein A2Y40_08010 [Candidatus Margulisbacteria bacterium GWF2_35_9]
MKRILGVLIIAVLSLGTVFANPGDLFFYTSMTGAGTTMGGLRIDLGNTMVTDLSATMTGSAYSYFADVYYGSWGLAITGTNTKTLATAALMYGVEKPINDAITLGINVPLVLWTDGASNLTFVGSWDIYAVLAF